MLLLLLWLRHYLSSEAQGLGIQIQGTKKRIESRLSLRHAVRSECLAGASRLERGIWAETARMRALLEMG